MSASNLCPKGVALKERLEASTMINLSLVYLQVNFYLSIESLGLEILHQF